MTRASVGPPGVRRVLTLAMTRSVTRNTQTASSAPSTPASLVSSMPSIVQTLYNNFHLLGCLADRNCPEDMMCLDGRCVTG